MYKPIVFNVELKNLNYKPNFSRKQEIKQGDNAKLIFKMIDVAAEDLKDMTAKIVVVMQDGSIFPFHDIPADDNVFACDLDSKHTCHDGVAKTEITVNGAVTSQVYEFDIIPTLSSKVEKEIILPQLSELEQKVQAALVDLEAVEQQIKTAETLRVEAETKRNALTERLLTNAMTLTDDYGQDWALTVDTDGMIRTIKKGVIN